MVDDKAGMVAVKVSDTGIGIPEENLPHIFERGFTTGKGGSGTGEGLAFVKEMIEEYHKGKINAQSEVGKGTTFTIYLPIGTGN